MEAAASSFIAMPSFIATPSFKGKGRCYDMIIEAPKIPKYKQHKQQQQ